MDAGAVATSYDGVPSAILAERLGVARLALYDTVGSTLDVAHALAGAGAPTGTLVLADRQVAGRGRQGRTWASPAGSGLWIAWLVRTTGAEGTLALRAGLAVGEALAALDVDVRLKWPNDVLLADRKLAGILCEARERWVAVGIGMNVAEPVPTGLEDRAIALASAAPDADRVGVLGVLVPRLAGLKAGDLTDVERAAWARRDWLAGRELVEPVAGKVLGLAADGALRVATANGERRIHGGTVTCSSQ